MILAQANLQKNGDRFTVTPYEKAQYERLNFSVLLELI